MKVLGISGSLRNDSYNAALLRNAPVELELWDGLKANPSLRRGRRRRAGAPGGRADARGRRRHRRDPLCYAEYNASDPGQLKNAIDWLSRRARRAFSATSRWPSSGEHRRVRRRLGQAELRKVLATAGARVIEDGVAVGRAHERFDADGVLIDDELSLSSDRSSKR
jgi:chromate reductase